MILNILPILNSDLEKLGNFEDTLWNALGRSQRRFDDLLEEGLAPLGKPRDEAARHL